MDEEDIEFTIAHNRRYSNAHLWFQDVKDERVMIGISEYLLADAGAVLRVNLPDQGQRSVKATCCSRCAPSTKPFASCARFR